MRIVVNGWFYGGLGSGSGQYLAGLLTAIGPRDKRPEIILVSPSLPEGIAAPDGDKKTFRVVRTGTPFDRVNPDLAKVWFEQVTFPRLCRAVGADVALVPYWGSPWWSACPLVVTIHDAIPRILPAYRGGLLQRAYTWLVSATARRASLVLTDSEASRRDLLATLAIPEKRVRAVHLAVSDRFAPVTDTSTLASVRTRYGLPESPYLLYLGGFDVRKNVARMLRGYARAAQAASLGRELPPLVIAGRPPTYDSQFTPDPRRITTELGIAPKVHFTGWVDEKDKPALYTMALGTLFLSEYEGFGLPLLEAMACGCPVISAH